MTPALIWLDERLASIGTTADEAVRTEHQTQGAMNVTVRNVITSMRMISAVDWAEFFESVSLVDAALRAGSDFAEMDFPTRDRYRHAIEELARGSRRPELEVTRCAIAAAKARGSRTADREAVSEAAQQEPGYYLISNGRRAIEREIGFRVPISEWLIRANAAAGILGYAGAIAIIGALIVVLPLVGRGGVRRQRMDALVAGDSRRGTGVGCRGGAGQPRHRQVSSEPELCPRWSLARGCPRTCARW